MKKQLDYIKKLENEILALETSLEVKAYLEKKKLRNELKALIKKYILSHLLVRPQKFGFKKSFNGLLTNPYISDDKKTIRGELRGNKNEVYLKLRHKESYSIKPSSILTFEQWKND